MQVRDVLGGFAAVPELPARAQFVRALEGETGVVHVPGLGGIEVDRAVEVEHHAVVAGIAGAHFRVMAAGAEMHQHHVVAVAHVQRAHLVRGARELQFLHRIAARGDGVTHGGIRHRIAIEAGAAPFAGEGFETVQEMRFGGDFRPGRRRGKRGADHQGGDQEGGSVTTHRGTPKRIGGGIVRRWRWRGVVADCLKPAQNRRCGGISASR